MTITLEYTIFQALNPYQGIQLLYTVNDSPGNPVQQVTIVSLERAGIVYTLTSPPSTADFLLAYPGATLVATIAA